MTDAMAATRMAAAAAMYTTMAKWPASHTEAALSTAPAHRIALYGHVSLVVLAC